MLCCQQALDVDLEARFLQGIPSGLSAVARAEERLTLSNAFGGSIGGPVADPGPAAGQWPAAPVCGWTVPSAEPPQAQKSGLVSGPDYFGNALHNDSGSPHARPRGSEQEVRLCERRDVCGILALPMIVTSDRAQIESVM